MKIGFDVEVWDGAAWLSLNDHLNYRIADGTLEQSTQGRTRNIVASAMYDGEWETHSTETNVSELIVVDILGQDQNHVTENWLALRDAVQQVTYNVRITMGNHRETWRCFPAEWSLNRGRVMANNVRMQVRLTVPRFPKVTYEVVV